MIDYIIAAFWLFIIGVEMARSKPQRIGVFIAAVCGFNFAFALVRIINTATKVVQP